jgi:hypothetical protein
MLAAKSSRIIITVNQKTIIISRKGSWQAGGMSNIN